MAKKTSTQHHHLDRRAEQIASVAAGDDDDLLDTREQAAWLGVSTQWLEIGRHKGYGPPYRRLGPQVIRYHRGTTRQWLKDREHVCTSEYRTQG